MLPSSRFPVCKRNIAVRCRDASYRFDREWKHAAIYSDRHLQRWKHPKPDDNRDVEFIESNRRNDRSHRFGDSKGPRHSYDHRCFRQHQWHCRLDRDPGNVVVNCGDSESGERNSRPDDSIHGNGDVFGWEHGGFDECDMEFLTTSVATISTTGLATGVATGTSGISASDGNIVGSTTLTVTAAPPILVSITVIPANPSVAVGGIVQFIAIGNYSNGTTQDLTATALWTTSSAPTATVSNVTTTAGQATGVASGTATITAASGAISGSTTLTVTATPANLYVGSVSTANCCLDAVNTSTNAVVKSIPVTTFNEPLGITPDQTRVYVADYTNNLIDVVDSTTNTLVTTIPVGPGRHCGCYHPEWTVWLCGGVWGQ